MKKVTIYGERCSGTNYLEHLLLLNFDVEIVWNYGWKHFFGFNDLTNSDDVLFIGIIRNLHDWLNSLYIEHYHLPDKLTKNIDTYLNNTFYSVVEDKIHFKDRHIETRNLYKNIFELRKVKNKYLIKTMPTLVKNYCLITYDELTNNFIDIMNKLKNSGLPIKNNIEFPLNILHNVKKSKDFVYIKKDFNIISKKKIDELILNDTELLFYEKLLFNY